jgi:hypothetical protein
MGNKVYAVYHCREVDYYNATQWKEELICVFDTLEKAKAFKAKYEIKYDPNKVVWYKKGVISIVEMPTTYDETKFWWLEKPKAVAPVEHVTREELAKIPKSNIPMFFEISEDEVEFNKE